MSKTKRNGGYILVDFSGVDISDSEPQIIPGIFTAFDAALKTNKPIIAINAVTFIEDVGTETVSPIPLYGAHYISENIIVMALGQAQVRVTRDGNTESIQIGA